MLVYLIRWHSKWLPKIIMVVMLCWTHKFVLWNYSYVAWARACHCCLFELFEDLPWSRELIGWRFSMICIY